MPSPVVADLELEGVVELAVRAEDPFGEEMADAVQQGLLPDPQALGMVAVPVGAVLVMLAFGLAGEVGDAVPRLPEHPPPAQVTADIRAQAVGAFGLGVCAPGVGGAGTLALLGHR
ncbi:hypothetical protein ETD83_33110 [Actinomadura soli]|uniref:Uncharacterized protein n=1 Tax=Actinomadura soli TaxID=2508997 RepID=A0A5C4J2J6_9ACTN|nr:hypothetical protein [Actinomadura soli]TMQ90969.1 hypothetical protein ETD83_33110 [Actinomadura soli]